MSSEEAGQSRSCNACRRAARRGQGGRLTTLNFRPGAVTTLNLGHVSIFYQVIFPVNKQGSIESPPRKQRLENDAKEREKQTIVAKKPVSRPNNASSDRRSLQKIHRKQSVGSTFHQMWGRQFDSLDMTSQATSSPGFKSVSLCK